MQEKYLTLKEKITFPMASFGRSGIYTIMSMFLLIFYTDAAKIDPVHAGYIILAGRVFDALNDPLMGMIVDRTHTKWGKMRPYLLFSPIPIALTTIALFFAPQFESYSLKVAYAAVTYILWGVAFTIQDVPFWGMSSVITPNENERTRFLSNGRLGSTAGGILPTVLIPVLVAENAFGLRNGYFVSAVIFALLGAALSMIPFFTCKERVTEERKDTRTFTENFRLIGKNKLLIIVILSAILGSTMVMANVSASYIHYYLIGVDNYGIIPNGFKMTSLTVAVGVGMVPAMIILPSLRKRFSLKAIYIGSSIFGVISHTAFWFIGYSNIYLVLLCLVFMGIPLGIYNVITYALIADSVDYIEYKTGERADGVCFAFQTLLSKITAGIATFATSIVLKVSQFQQPINDVIQTQSETTKTGLFFMITLLPAIGFALTIIPMLFNDYTGEKKERIKKELELRRNKTEYSELNENI